MWARQHVSRLVYCTLSEKYRKLYISFSKRRKKSAVKNSNASEQLHFLRCIGVNVNGKYSNLVLKTWVWTLKNWHQIQRKSWILERTIIRLKRANVVPGKSFVLQKMFLWWRGCGGGIKLIFSPYCFFFLLLFCARLFLPHGSDRLFELKGKAIRS